jgi:AcrR family transcriptional regulator
MVNTISNQSPRERILATSMDLFYRQGFTSTGINQIIAEAGVAKASFYDHFPSKEDLLVAYAAEMARIEIAAIREDVMKQPSARSRFFGPLTLLPEWLESTQYRGCPFQNVMAEAPPHATAVWEVARQHRESLRTLFVELALALKNSEPEMRHLQPESVATTYLVVFEGAIALCVAYRDAWPVEQAKQMLLATLQNPKN